MDSLSPLLVGELRHRAITWLLSMISRRSHCLGTELQGLSGSAPSSCLLSAQGSCLERAENLMLSLQVWKNHVHPITTRCPKPAQPVTKFWLQAGHRSRQVLRQAGKAVKPKWIHNHHQLLGTTGRKTCLPQKPTAAPGKLIV